MLGRIYGESVWDKLLFASEKFYSGKYVQIYSGNVNEDSNILTAVYHIVNCKAKNKYVDNPEIIRYIRETDDLEGQTLFLYEAIFIGCIKSGLSVNERFAIFPGKGVFTASADNISIAYGIKNGGLQVGNILDSLDTKVKVEVNKIFNPHLLIVGKTNSGKSYFAKGLIESIIKNNSEYDILVFAPSDEYNQLTDKVKINKVDSNKLVLSYNKEAFSYFWDLTLTEVKLLSKINIGSRKKYSSSDLLEELITQNIPKPKQIQEQLPNFPSDNSSDYVIPQQISVLADKIRRININFSTHSEEFSNLNGSNIIDMTDSTQNEQEIYLNSILGKLFFTQKKIPAQKRKNKIIFIDEAHNYVPSTTKTFCKDIIVRIAREGRKFGISLCLITQRPRNFDQTAFSQSGNKCIFALPHPDDVRHVLQDASYYSAELSNVIQRQHQGECTINGDAFMDAFTFMVNFE